MKYIKRITLENFQSHKHSIIDLDEKLNVIVGPSDSGKSAIIRGIKWALYNEPSGDYFIREGEKECSIILEFNDNTLLKRYRSKSKNQYILINNKGEEVKYEGFGSGVPSEIVDTIGIKKIYLDSDESDSINLGEQLDGAFLLSEKTSTRASAIGRLVGVNIVDDALREVLRDSRALNISKKNLEESVTQFGKEISSYDYLDDIKTKLDSIVEIRTILSNNQVKLEKLMSSRNKLKEINNDLNDTKQIINQLQTVDKLNIIITYMDNKYINYKYLTNYYTNIRKIRLSIEDNNKIVSNLGNINHAFNKVTKLDKLNSKYNKFQMLQQKNVLLENERSNLEHTISKLSNIRSIDEKLEKIPLIYVQLMKLNDVYIKYRNTINSIKIGRKYIENLYGLEKVDVNTKLIIDKSKILTELNKLYSILLINNKEKQKEIEAISALKSSTHIQLKEYQELLRKVEICPFCLSDIDEHKIDHIINHYIGG